MVFNSLAGVWLVIVIVIIWLAGISFFLFKALSNYNRLTRGISDKTLSAILTKFLDEEKTTQSELKQVLTEVAKVRKEGLHSLQKVGLVRFNPFADTGGDQSFVLALLDGSNTGIVITSLYSRSGVRWYVKTIRQGKGIEHELSNEEQEALKKALHS